MGRGLLPCFPALDLGGNDPFSVLLFNHAWGEGDVRFAPLLCGESGPGGLFSWLVSYGAAAYSPAAAQASAARRRHPQLRRGPSLPRRLAGPASSNAGPAFPFWPPPKPFRAAAFLRLGSLTVPAPPQPAPSPPAPPPSYAHFRQPGAFAKRRAPLPGASGRGGYRLGVVSGRVKRP